ncbi:hypothetical protein ACG9X6_15345 [Acinetobacter guillouiae]|uniref:hypothetical protein n=1 Tax=Acinetobacter guillouiae TaxID=106649 RepID=UPI003AF7A40D
MTKVKCGKCLACTYYNGLNGSGYQPCHNPTVTRLRSPEYVKPPSLEILYSAEKSNDLVHGWDWVLVWFFGFVFGIIIGILILKISMN